MNIGHVIFCSVPLVLFLRFTVLSVIVTMTDCLFIYLFIYFIPFFPFFKVSGLELPLPPKKVFGNMDTTFIAERQNGLQNYVNFILAHPVLARHISVKRFLDPVNYSCDFQGTAVLVLNHYVISEIHFQVYLSFSNSLIIHKENSKEINV